MFTQDRTQALVERVRAAIADGTALAPRGGGSKQFYGQAPAAQTLEVGGHRGVLHYEPGEEVLRARAGTAVDDLERLLARHGAMLPFDTPYYGPGATLGGTIATGLAAPRLPYGGGLREQVIGVEFINGHGEVVEFGGRLTPARIGLNIARLMVGSLGTLGVLLTVSVQVVPRPERELSLVQEMGAARALNEMAALATRWLPLTGSCWHDGKLHLRLAGTAESIAQARGQLGGEECPSRQDLWQRLRDHTLPFFADETPLWRIALPPAAPELTLDGAWLYERHGRLRWLKSELPAGRIRQAVTNQGGQATFFRGHAADVEVFHPLPEALFAMHRSIKYAFDPQRIFNPGRLYTDL